MPFTLGWLYTRTAGICGRSPALLAISIFTVQTLLFCTHPLLWPLGTFLSVPLALGLRACCCGPHGPGRAGLRLPLHDCPHPWWPG